MIGTPPEGFPVVRRGRDEPARGAVKPHLGVDLNGLRFTQPVLSRVGRLATGRDVPGLVDARRLGGSRDPAASRSRLVEGVTPPRASETSSGLASRPSATRIPA